MSVDLCGGLGLCVQVAVCTVCKYPCPREYIVCSNLDPIDYSEFSRLTFSGEKVLKSDSHDDSNV